MIKYASIITIVFFLFTMPFVIAATEGTKADSPFFNAANQRSVSIVGKGVTLSLKNTPLLEAIKLVAAQDTRLMPRIKELPDHVHVTMEFVNVDSIHAMQIICDAANLQMTDPVRYEPLDKLIFEIQSKISAPVKPTTPLSPQIIPDKGVLFRPNEPFVLPILPDGVFPRRPMPFQGDRKLVDLQVKNAPLEKAAAQLTKVSGYDILVDPAVPKGIKVTASVFKMPIGDVLTMLVQQAGLTYSVSYRHDEQEVVIARAFLADKQRLLKNENDNNTKLLSQLQEAVSQARIRFEAGVASRQELTSAERDLTVFLSTSERNMDILKQNVQAAEQALIRAEKAVKEGTDMPSANSIPVIHIVPIPELKVTLPEGMPRPEYFLVPKSSGGVKFLDNKPEVLPQTQ